jgi:predicted ABC-type transport system involved in lysophospholipase L1 biosynthesis ATPase subunit
MSDMHTDTSEYLVEARDVHKVYDTGKVKVHALNGVSLAIGHGEMVAIMGPSGCGKTTLLNCLSGLDAVDEGDVLIEGTSLKSMSDRERTDYRALRMGFIFQFYNLMPVLNAVENVELPLLVARRSQKEARELALAALELVGLTERAHRVLIEQGRRGGPMLSLVRLVQSQAICIRVILLVADDRPRAAYNMDLVGAHPRVACHQAEAFYEDVARRMTTAVSTREVTNHLVEEPRLTASAWHGLSTPAAMIRASLEFGRRSFFTEMVRVADLVNVPGLAEAVSARPGACAPKVSRLDSMSTQESSG